MYSVPSSKQTTFVYGPEIYEKLILKDHLLYKINEKVDFSFINEVCKDLYSSNKGRPVTNTPEMLLRSAVVQYLYDYSDRQMEYEAQVNIMVKWFIGLNLEDNAYDHSALGYFRDKLGNDKWNDIFYQLLKQIQDAGFSKGSTQYIDATHVIANIAIPGTIGIIRQGITEVLKSLKKEDPHLYKNLGGKRQALKREKVYNLNQKEKEEKLVNIVKEAQNVIQKTECFDEPVKEKVEILKRILGENVLEEEGNVCRRKGQVKDRIVNPVDPDARHGAKSDDKKFVGYKVNSTMSEDGFITNINATCGNSYDGDLLLPLIDKGLANGQIISKVVADGAYGSATNRFELLKRDAVLIAPVSKDANTSGNYYPQAMFSIDESGVTCPAGHRTMISYHDKKKGTILYHFKKSDCHKCSLKQKCTKLDHRTITVSKHYSIFREAKRYSKSQDYKDDMKMRAHIEPKQGEMKRFHGLNRAKFWGIEKLNVQAMLTGIVVNLKRFIKMSSDSYRNMC
jgi:transposase